MKNMKNMLVSLCRSLPLIHSCALVVALPFFWHLWSLTNPDHWLAIRQQTAWCGQYSGGWQPGRKLVKGSCVLDMWDRTPWMQAWNIYNGTISDFRSICFPFLFLHAPGCANMEQINRSLLQLVQVQFSCLGGRCSTRATCCRGGTLSANTSKKRDTAWRSKRWSARMR